MISDAFFSFTLSLLSCSFRARKLPSLLSQLKFSIRVQSSRARPNYSIQRAHDCPHNARTHPSLVLSSQSPKMDSMPTGIQDLVAAGMRGIGELPTLESTLEYLKITHHEPETATQHVEHVSAPAAIEHHQVHLPPGISETDIEKENKWFIGSIDCGTTSSRFLIFNGEGTPTASHQIEFENIYPESGYGVISSGFWDVD